MRLIKINDLMRSFSISIYYYNLIQMKNIVLILILAIIFTIQGGPILDKLPVTF